MFVKVLKSQARLVFLEDRCQGLLVSSKCKVQQLAVRVNVLNSSVFFSDTVVFLDLKHFF